MALVLALTKYTPEATRSLLSEGPTARAAYISKMVEAVGGKVLGYYFAEGSDFDVVGLFEVPDEMRASVAGSIAVGALNWSSGMAESLRAVWLTTPEEFEAALKTTTGVAAPGKE